MSQFWTMHTAKRAEQSSKKTLKLKEILHNLLCHLVSVCIIVLPNSYIFVWRIYFLDDVTATFLYQAGVIRGRLGWCLQKDTAVEGWFPERNTITLKPSMERHNGYLLDKSFSHAEFHRFNVIDIMSHTTSLTLEFSPIVFSRTDFSHLYFWYTWWYNRFSWNSVNSVLQYAGYF